MFLITVQFRSIHDALWAPCGQLDLMYLTETMGQSRVLAFDNHDTFVNDGLAQFLDSTNFFKYQFPTPNKRKL